MCGKTVSQADPKTEASNQHSILEEFSSSKPQILQVSNSKGIYKQGDWKCDSESEN